MNLVLDKMQAMHDYEDCYGADSEDVPGMMAAPCLSGFSNDELLTLCYVWFVFFSWAS